MTWLRPYFLPQLPPRTLESAHLALSVSFPSSRVTLDPMRVSSASLTRRSNLRTYDPTYHIPPSAYNTLSLPLSFALTRPLLLCAGPPRRCPQHARNRPAQTRPDHLHHLHHHDSARQSRVAAVRSFFSQSACAFEDDLQPSPPPQSHRRLSSTTLPPNPRGRRLQFSHPSHFFILRELPFQHRTCCHGAT